MSALALDFTDNRAPTWLVMPGQGHLPPPGSNAILMQLEHTLVAPGGRDAGHAPCGEVPTLDGEGKYLVRLEGGPDAYKSAASIIEYSNANIRNVTNSELAPLYGDRAHYIAPLLTSPSLLASKRRKVVVATMHGSPDSGRRGALKRELAARNIDLRNTAGVWDRYEPHFDEVAVLVNVHQTPHHHTLEELRVLPALMRGVIVVTEEVPLLDSIPYGDLLVSAPIDKLAATVEEVVNLYEDLWDHTQRHDQLWGLHELLARQNHDAFLKMIRRLGG